MRIENSFIPVHGVGEVTERELWRAGITTWEEFDGSVVGPTRAERIYKFIERSSNHLQASNPSYFEETFPSGTHWRLYENFRDQTSFLDIETTGLSRYRNDVTVVSIHQQDTTTSLVRGLNLTTDRLRDELANTKLIVTFNGKQFDIPFLEREFDLDITTPHIDLRYASRKAGLQGNLDDIEQQLGISRTHPDIDGHDAIRLWNRWETGDAGALDKLVAYNREDTKNLESIMEIVANRLHNTVFREPVEDHKLE